MPLDAICLSALHHELESALLGARIDKIHQPARDEVILSLRGHNGGMRLLFSANPTRPRAHLTQSPRENPSDAPMFCMLLRKHLSGGRLISITQPPMERLLHFAFEATDDLGDKTVKTLVLEAMGRHANLLLLDGENRILDCLRRVDADMSAERQLLPGMFYRFPPTQGKCNPQDTSPDEQLRLLSQISREKPMERCLVETFGGISPLIARELTFEVTGDSNAPLGVHGEALLTHLHALLDMVAKGNARPCLLMREGAAVDFSFRPILQYGSETESVEFASFSALLDAFYAKRETSERVRQKGQDLIRSATTARDRTARKLGFQRKELDETKQRDALRQKGELITANLYRLEKGMLELSCENYYEPDAPEIHIKLDPLRTPQQNAARYFKDYQRAKTAEQMLSEQIAKGETELRYLQSVLESLTRAEGERDLEEIRRELEEGGYVRRRSKVKGRIKKTTSLPMRFLSSTGLLLSVGRNNIQNDELTCRIAKRTDLWFHVQTIHGAHVILHTEGREADVQSMTEAALLAAWFSQGRTGVKVPVDYTAVRFVKKPSGAKPGMVIYTTYETAFVTPEEALIARIQKA